MEEYISWRFPIFPGRYQPSIFGTIELNFCVRDGNRWTLNVINTKFFELLAHIYSKTLSGHYSIFFTSSFKKSGDSWGNRTPVTGVRGRCLNRLTNEPHIYGYEVKYAT